VETRSAPGEGTDVGGRKARCRAHLELTARKAKVQVPQALEREPHQCICSYIIVVDIGGKAQVRTRSSASHTSAYVHTPSSISGDSKRLHGKKGKRAERPGGERIRRERARERRRGRNEDGWGPCNRRSGIEEGSRSREAAVICTPSPWIPSARPCGRCRAERAALFRTGSVTIARSVAAWSAASRVRARSDS
jgi:hypothetical protein